MSLYQNLRNVEQAEGLETTVCPLLTCPRDGAPKGRSTWEEVKKLHVAQPAARSRQIVFVECTLDGHLQHSKFCGFEGPQKSRSLVRENIMANE